MRNLKLLKVNLSSEKMIEMELDANLIGGKKLAYDLIRLSDPFSDDNVLVFTTGPFTGEKGIPNGGRFAIGTCTMNGKSISSVGGIFGISMKLNGYDGLIIEGKAKHLSYISIKNSEVEILDASHLKGKNVTECTKALSFEHSSVACIGSAGEVFIPFSVVIFDFNIPAGKDGFGAVMGSKNLKAIRITTNEEVKDPCLECPIKCEKRHEHIERAGRTFINNVSEDENMVKKFVNLCNDIGVDSIRAGEMITCLPNSSEEFLNLIMDSRQTYIPKSEIKMDPIKDMMDTFGFCAFSYGILKSEDYKKIIREKFFEQRSN